VKVGEYLADKIEGKLQFYESCLEKINSTYLAEVARVVRRQFKDDPAWARYFDVRPSYIAEELSDIRILIAQGKIAEADYAFDRFRDRIDFVERRLRHRYLTAGIATSIGGKKSAALKWNGADRHANEKLMYRMWLRERAKLGSNGKADGAIAKRFKRSPRTVRTVRARIGNQLSLSK
jgi:hypothetical protein